MTVIIGIDPHKASHTAVAIDGDEEQLGPSRCEPPVRQVAQLLCWAEPFAKRTWAIESAGGLGYLLAQQLVAEGEDVVDVPATLASRIRLLGTVVPTRTTPTMRSRWRSRRCGRRTCVRVASGRISEVLRLLAKRNIDIGNQRSRVVSRIHSLLAELARGGIAKEIYASDVDASHGQLVPRPRSRSRYDLALELLDDMRRLDIQLKVSHRRIRAAVQASATSLTELFGVGPILAAIVIGNTGDSADSPTAITMPPTTAPRRSSSPRRDGLCIGCLTRGNRKLNHALHMAAITQIRNPGTQGRIYFERKVAEGKTKKEALRSLKRHISNAVYRQLVLDAQ